MRLLILPAVILMSLSAQAQETNPQLAMERESIKTVEVLLEEPQANSYNIIEFMSYMSPEVFKKSILTTAKENGSDKVHYAFEGQYYGVDCFISTMRYSRKQCSVYKK